MEEVNMRKNFTAFLLLICMTVTNISPTYAYIGDEMTKTSILEKKEDTYTLENYVKTPEEAQEIQENYFLSNRTEPYKITLDAKTYDDWLVYNEKKENVDYFKPNKFRDEIDNGLGYYCHNGGVNDFFENHELLTAHNGKKYIVLNLKNSNTNKFLEQLSKMQEVRDKFLATMPNLDEMSDYEKVLGILSFMSYIKYGFDEKGNTIDDAYTTLTGGKATCGGFSEAFNFLAKAINLQSEKIRNPGVHAWNVVKICGKWFEVEPNSKNDITQKDNTRNVNMRLVLRGSDFMLQNPNYENTTLRESLPVSKSDYMDYKDHNYTNHVIKWDGNKAIFYRTCSDCGEYENDGFEYNSKYKYYHLVDRKYTGTDCDVTKVSETKCGNATVTKYEASVTVDGKNYTSEHTVVDGECSHTVKDSDIKVIRKATCSEEGEIEKTCETCGYTWTESIPKTEHHYVTTTTKLDTCEEKSEYTVEKCSECGDVKSTSKKLYYSAHDFQFTSHKKEPTCTETGEDIYTCTKCNKTEIREVAAKGHGETELVNVKEPTCEEDGYTGDEKCKVCGQIAKKGKTIEKLRHQLIGYNEKTYKTEADAEHEGLTLKYSYDMFIVECKRENCSYRSESVDESTKKLAGWILADGTEVEKKYGCKYEYVKDVSGNWMVKKIDGTTKPAENPTTKPAGAVKPFGETSGKKNEPAETKMKVPAKVKISSAKNLKGKKIAIKWKKVKKATKYQVKAVLGNKVVTKTTTKTSCTIKKLKKKKTYKIYVRAYNKAGYGKWSKAKKVTIKNKQ